LDNEVTVDAPDSFWVSDITYSHTQEGSLYPAVILDLCNSRIVCWSTSSRLTHPMAVDALKMALNSEPLHRG
jgi:putative transposase